MSQRGSLHSLKRLVSTAAVVAVCVCGGGERLPVHNISLSLCVCVCVCTVQLLAKEIQVEQNTILQCVRYAVRNNFFGVGGGVTDTGVSCRGQEREGSQEKVRGQEGDQTS